MKNSVCLCMVLIGTNLTAGAVRAEAPNPRPGASTPVQVMNTPSNPVPVTGNMTVTGTADVNVTNSSVPVTQSGLWTVDVAAQEPFQAGTVPTGFDGGLGSAELIVVPEGMRLVIEGVSASVNTTSGDGLASVNVNTGDFDRVNELTCVPIGATGNDLNHFFQCSTQVKLHAGPGTTVTFSVSTPGNDGGFFRVFASGYYVAVP